MKTAELTETLRRMAGGLPSGAALPTQVRLRETYGVTTFTVSQSLRRLEAEGVITVIPKRGAYVREAPPLQQRYIQVVYLDNPASVRLPEYGLGGFIWATGRLGMACRSMHLDHAEVDALLRAVDDCCRAAECVGVVVSGFVSETVAERLQAVRLPLALFGDPMTPRAWPGLPIICGDNFQGGVLAARELMAKGSREALLLNFAEGETDWPWVREARAGALASLAEQDVSPFIPAASTFDEVIGQVQEWLSPKTASRVGVLCRTTTALQQAAAVREVLGRNGCEAVIGLLDVGIRPAEIPDFVAVRVTCPVERLAEAAVTRLMAMRRGVDAGGRQPVPHEVVA